LYLLSSAPLVVRERYAQGRGCCCPVSSPFATTCVRSYVRADEAVKNKIPVPDPRFECSVSFSPPFSFSSFFCSFASFPLALLLQGAVLPLRVLMLLPALGAGGRWHQGAARGRQPGLRGPQGPPTARLQPGTKSGLVGFGWVGSSGFGLRTIP